MKKFLAALTIAMTPWWALAVDVNINLGAPRLQVPGATITFGSRNAQGHYWDGSTWRDPAYWRQHHGPRGERYYTGEDRPGVPFQNGRHCPPGQAQKGRCKSPHGEHTQGRSNRHHE